MFWYRKRKYSSDCQCGLGSDSSDLNRACTTLGLVIFGKLLNSPLPQFVIREVNIAVVPVLNDCCLTCNICEALRGIHGTVLLVLVVVLWDEESDVSSSLIPKKNFRVDRDSKQSEVYWKQEASWCSSQEGDTREELPEKLASAGSFVHKVCVSD